MHLQEKRSYGQTRAGRYALVNRTPPHAGWSSAEDETMAPAWMAELSEEWVEPVEDEERVEEQEQPSDQLDFGSLVIDDVPLPSPSQASMDGGNGSPLPFGTTIFHDAHHPTDEQQDEKSYQVGSILFSPSKKRSMPGSAPASPNAAPSPGQQLAMAAAAFNKDLLHEAEDSRLEDEQVNPATSIQVNKPVPVNRLQSLFMQPVSPPPAQTAAATSEAQQERSSVLGQSQGIQYSDYLEEAAHASFIADQQLKDIPDPSFDVESLQASMRDIDLNNSTNAKEDVSTRAYSSYSSCLAR